MKPRLRVHIKKNEYKDNAVVFHFDKSLSGNAKCRLSGVDIDHQCEKDLTGSLAVFRMPQHGTYELCLLSDSWDENIHDSLLIETATIADNPKGYIIDTGHGKIYYDALKTTFK